MNEIDQVTIGKRAIHTQLLVQAMRAVPVGQTFTYPEAEKATNLPKAKLMPYLYSAINILLTEYGMNFVCERNVGYTHLHAENVPKYANHKHLTKIRRINRKQRHHLDSVDPAELSKDAQTEYSLGIANLAFFESVADRKSQREIKKLTTQGQADSVKELDKSAIIDMYKGLWKR